jgi:ABC-type maltose transport system permease subunit
MYFASIPRAIEGRSQQQSNPKSIIIAQIASFILNDEVDAMDDHEKLIIIIITGKIMKEYIILGSLEINFISLIKCAMIG